MCETHKSFSRVGTIALWLASSSAAAAAFAFDLTETRSLLDRGDAPKAVELLTAEVNENPAHEAARMQLAEACEKNGQPDDAVKIWEQVLVLSQDPANLHTARKALSRLLRNKLDQADQAESTPSSTRPDPFKIPMPPIEWEGLDVVEDTQYLPPILPPPYTFEPPPKVHETRHFTVYSTNERLSKLIGERAEIYLDFMVNALFHGKPWPVRIPILMYTTREDYVSHGGPENSGGVTIPHISGKTEAVLLFQFREGASGSSGASGRGSRRGGGSPTSGGNISHYSIESVLTHELTHTILIEFFAGKETPQWLHEAVAGRFEQTRDHYGEAARLARHVIAGEYFPLRDLFEQKGYPDRDRISLFYEQATIVVLYLFEAGPVAMNAFLTELAAGHGHDAAVAAVLGIPPENAVEELERRWVAWMKLRYLKDLNNESDKTETVQASVSTDRAFLPSVNELATVTQIPAWREIPLTSLDAFGDTGRSKETWKLENAALQAHIPGDDGSALLPIRMNERPPVVISCNVRSLADPTQTNRLFGFTQLDHALNDLRVEALAPLADNNEHALIAVFGDDLAVYLDGKCTGRFAAVHRDDKLAPDIDYPLALVAYSSVEVKNLKVAHVEKFSDEPVTPPAQDQASPDRGRERDRTRKPATPEEPRRRRPRRP